ncbi:hypothetical protein [Streptomyces sp. NBC_01198]|uniref:hypothetical protein n=1 Tax=Streptomyces sp. NBC_01198 TaxID=2903769 RepID=UPI002E0D661D
MDSSEYDEYDAIVRVPKGARLAQSRKTKDARRGLTRDPDTNELGHAEIFLTKEDEPEPVAAYPVRLGKSSLQVAAVGQARLTPCPRDRFVAVQGGPQAAVRPWSAAAQRHREGRRGARARHENAVLPRQIPGPVRYERADLLWLAALSSVIPRHRRQAVVPVPPGTLPAWHRKFIAAKWAIEPDGRRPGLQSRNHQPVPDHQLTQRTPSSEGESYL